MKNWLTHDKGRRLTLTQKTIKRMLDILDTQYAYCPESARDPYSHKRDPQAAYYLGMRTMAAALIDEEAGFKETLTWKDGKHTVEPSKEYERARKEARQRAIDLQAELAARAVSADELAAMQAEFETLAAEYDLTEEFRENGII